MGSSSGSLRHLSTVPGLKDPVISAFRRRIYNQDNDVFLIIAGPRGSTKSGSGQTMGYEMDIDINGRTRFFLDKKYFPRGFSLKPGEMMPRVIYKPSHLLDMLNNNEKFPKKSCILWDEAGVEGDARDFASKKNKMIKRVFQTVRSLNWFLILTAVTIKDFDVGLERNAGFYMRTFGKTMLPRNGKLAPYGVTKIYKIQTNPTTGKRITPFIRYSEDGIRKVLSEPYYVRKPPAWLENPYKRCKKLFQDKLYGEYSMEMDNIDDFALNNKTTTEIELVNEKIKEVVGNPLDYYDEKKKKFLVPAIQFLGSVKISSESKARKVVQLLDLKLQRGEIRLE